MNQSNHDWYFDEWSYNGSQCGTRVHSNIPTATAMGNSKLLLAAVKERVHVTPCAYP